MPPLTTRVGHTRTWPPSLVHSTKTFQGGYGHPRKPPHPPPTSSTTPTFTWIAPTYLVAFVTHCKPRAVHTLPLIPRTITAALLRQQRLSFDLTHFPPRSHPSPLRPHPPLSSITSTSPRTHPSTSAPHSCSLVVRRKLRAVLRAVCGLIHHILMAHS